MNNFEKIKKFYTEKDIARAIAEGIIKDDFCNIKLSQFNDLNELETSIFMYLCQKPINDIPDILPGDICISKTEDGKQIVAMAVENEYGMIMFSNRDSGTIFLSYCPADDENLSAIYRVKQDNIVERIWPAKKEGK